MNGRVSPAALARLRETVEELAQEVAPNRFVWTRFSCEPDPEDMPKDGPGLLIVFPCTRTGPHTHEHPDPHEDRPPGVAEVVWVPPDADVEEVGEAIRTAPEEGLTVHRASDPRARRGGGH